MRQLTEQTEELLTLHEIREPAPAGPSFEELVASLAVIDTTIRAKAACEIRTFGAAAIEPLCAALRDKEVRVRLAAAESLGEIGDQRAIQPLVAALRELFPGRSPRRYRTVGILAAITFPLAIISGGIVRLWELGVPPIASAAGIAAVIAILAANRKVAGFIADSFDVPGQSDAGPCLVFSQALTRIADRCPAPELRSALPALKEIAADGLQQNRRTRADSRNAARRIEELTAQLDALPVTASAPVTDAETLPRASDGPV